MYHLPPSFLLFTLFRNYPQSLPLLPPYYHPFSLLLTHTYKHTCACTNIYTYIIYIYNIHYVYPSESILSFAIYGFRVGTLHWTPNKKAHHWEKVIPLLSAVISYWWWWWDFIKISPSILTSPFMCFWCTSLQGFLCSYFQEKPFLTFWYSGFCHVSASSSSTFPDTWLWYTCFIWGLALQICWSLHHLQMQLSVTVSFVVKRGFCDDWC